MTPFVPSDGANAIAVSRGWIPITAGDGADANPATYAPPSGVVTITGLVQAGEHQEGLEAADPAAGRLVSLARVDLGRLQQQVSERIAPVWVQLTDQQPPQPGPLPVKVAAPTLDDGPHLNYAGQWFIYAGLTMIVYPLAIRRAAKSREAKAAAAADVTDAGPDGRVEVQPVDDDSVAAR
jgi:surfeit locus 1 family protein